MDTTWVKGTDIQNGQLLNEWIAPWSERLISGYLTVLYYQNDETWPTAIQRYVYGLYWDSVHSFGGIEPVFLLGARDQLLPVERFFEDCRPADSFKLSFSTSGHHALQQPCLGSPVGCL